MSSDYGNSEIEVEAINNLRDFFLDINKETDRGMALVGAAILDENLANTLQSFMCEEGVAHKLVRELNGPLSQFSARIDAALALGLIDDFEHGELTLVRKIRNKFAHSTHGVSFQSDPIKGLCASFASQMPGGTSGNPTPPRSRFANVLVVLAMRLLYRHLWVRKSQLKKRDWVGVSLTGAEGWRSFQEEKPAPGQPYVGYRHDSAGNFFPYIAFGKSDADV